MRPWNHGKLGKGSKHPAKSQEIHLNAPDFLQSRILPKSESYRVIKGLFVFDGRRGIRPSAPNDERTASTYIFGAVCPRDGKGAALVLPACNTEAMNLHLAEIERAIEPGPHAMLLDHQAGWHMSTHLVVPSNITIVALPPKSPELNPMENVWQFMRDNWLSNRIFRSYEDLLMHCCEAWNKLVDQPWRIMSIGLRDWAHEC